MFSREYLAALAELTGFPMSALQKQMLLISVLREMKRHPLLGPAYALRGGTAINLIWFNLPRLSVDIDLNYVGSPVREVMQREREVLEVEMTRLLGALDITVERTPPEHAGGKWRLRTRSALGGNLTLEIDLNYLMRVPIWGVLAKPVRSPDPDFSTDFPTVSLEELFAGKIKALLERAAARDLYDVWSLSQGSVQVDLSHLRKAVALFGVTSLHDWRTMNASAIDDITEAKVVQELRPLLRGGEVPDLAAMKESAHTLLGSLLVYDHREQLFLDSFLDQGEYRPELLFDDANLARALSLHPAVLWKLQNLREHKGLQ